MTRTITDHEDAIIADLNTAEDKLRDIAKICRNHDTYNAKTLAMMIEQRIARQESKANSCKVGVGNYYWAIIDGKKCVLRCEALGDDPQFGIAGLWECGIGMSEISRIVCQIDTPSIIRGAEDYYG